MTLLTLFATAVTEVTASMWIVAVLSDTAIILTAIIMH